MFCQLPWLISIPFHKPLSSLLERRGEKGIPVFICKLAGGREPAGFQRRGYIWAFLLPSAIGLYDRQLKRGCSFQHHAQGHVCVCVCVREREREGLAQENSTHPYTQVGVEKSDVRLAPGRQLASRKRQLDHYRAQACGTDESVHCPSSIMAHYATKHSFQGLSRESAPADRCLCSIGCTKTRKPLPLGP